MISATNCGSLRILSLIRSTSVASSRWSSFEGRFFMAPILPVAVVGLIDHHIDDGRAIVLQGLLQGRAEVIGALDAGAGDAPNRGLLGEVQRRVFQVQADELTLAAGLAQ